MHHIGIDYSGAGTADTPLTGLRAYACNGDSPRCAEVLPAHGSKYWSRRALTHWLARLLETASPIVVGIDHSFSFPLHYFETHDLPLQWDAFLEDFARHWPTDQPQVTVQSIRDGVCGLGAARGGNARWRRLAEQRSRGAKSSFHFDVPGSVAKSTHAGLPWLLWLRRELGADLHFWPYDGWVPPAGRSVIAEVYPSLWNRLHPRRDRTPDQHDAYCVARWLRDSDAAGTLAAHFEPELSARERAVAQIEGWILGVT